VESNEQLVSMNEIEILNRSLFSKYVRTSTDELNRGGDFFLIIIIDDDDGIDPSFFRPFVINGRKSIADADDGIWQWFERLVTVYRRFDICWLSDSGLVRRFKFSQFDRDVGIDICELKWL